MIRRALPLIVSVVLSTLLLLPIAAAQPPAKVPRIAVLSPVDLSHLRQVLRQGLRDLGYVDGQNIAIEDRHAGGQLDQLPALSAELVRLKFDVIVTSGAAAARAAKQATSTIPIVMAQINDPVSLGLVPSLAKPGGNITGLANLHSELAAKQLELLKEAVPKLSRLAVLWNPLNPGAEHIVKHLRHPSQALGVTLRSVEVRAPDELEAAFATVSRQQPNALLLPPDPFFFPHRKQIVDLTAKNRLPAMFGWREFVEAGGLIAYGPSIPDMFRRAAVYVDKILKGAKPADLPIEQPTKFELVVNLKTAKALGLTIPQSVLIRADHVIQ